MKLLEFLFPFLFVRNWHTGQKEISRPRAWLFGTAIGFLVVGIIAISFLQLPITYVKS